MQNITLSNGISMPMLGFGTFQIPPEDTERLVASAIQAGYRHIDTAQAYLNEKEVALAVKNSGMARDAFFLTTKVWVSNYGAAKASVERSLQRMGLDYLDLVLLHQPVGDVFAAWRDLEALYREGKVKAVGVSNFTAARIADLAAFHSFVPMVNQIEVNPFFQRALEVEKLQGQGVAVQAWGSFAEGKNDIFHHPVLTQIGASYGKTPAQVMSRWLLERGIVALAKSSYMQRMQENLAVWDFSLSDTDKAQIATMDLGKSLIFDHGNPELIRFLAEFRVDV